MKTTIHRCVPFSNPSCVWRDLGPILVPDTLAPGRHRRHEMNYYALSVLDNFRKLSNNMRARFLWARDPVEFTSELRSGQPLGIGLGC